jgi:thioesterase domain-containing protein
MVTFLRPRHLEYAARLLLSDKGSRSDWSPLVPIRPDGDRAPLFVVGGIGGDVGSFDSLVRHLPPAQPVYGLQAPGPDLPLDPSLRIESMATTCADAMRQVHPVGPYLMAAYSAGDILAYEVAQQLLAGGHQVALLAMIDAQDPQPATERLRCTPAWALRFAKNVACWLVDDLLASNAADLIVSAQSQARLLRAWTRRIVHASREQADIRDRLGAPKFPERYVPWLEAYQDARERYHPQPYRGRFLLLRARTRPFFGNLARDNGWGALVPGRLDVRVIAGDHINILREPRVRLVAAALTNAMDEAIIASGPW